MTLVPGQRAPVAGPEVRVEVRAAAHDLWRRRFSLVAAPLDAAGRATGTPLYAIDGAGRGPFAFEAEDLLTVRLGQMPAGIARLHLLAYVLGGPATGVTFKDLRGLEVRIEDRRLELDLRDQGHATLHLLDLYRHGDGWKVQAGGEGFVGGLGVVGARIEAPLDSGHGLPEPPPGPDLPPPRRDGGGGSSGSAFAVDDRHVLTNHHVIEDAEEVEVIGGRGRGRGRVLFSDPVNDLALVETDLRFATSARFRADPPVRLGEDVVLIGYPLRDLLGHGPQVTAGNVSGLCGLGNSATQLQYTAPTSSGSSGGPILDSGGLVVGVVRAGLAHDVLRSTGSASENVNFGVKADVARLFLDAAGLKAASAPPRGGRDRASVAEEARAWTVCLRVRT